MININFCHRADEAICYMKNSVDICYIIYVILCFTPYVLNFDVKLLVQGGTKLHVLQPKTSLKKHCLFS